MQKRFLFLCLGLSANLCAQDLHFSQPNFNPLHHSPARCGVFEGDWQLSGQFRQQWPSVPVQYQTYAVGFEYKLLRSKQSALNVGLQLQQDQAGDATLRWTQGGVQVAAVRSISERQAISVGMSVTGVQRSFDVTRLKFMNQWNVDSYNPSLPSQEVAKRNSGLTASVGAGINWHLAATEGQRTRANVSVGAFHVNGPRVNFTDEKDYRLPVRWAIMGDLAWQMNDNLDLMTNALFQTMGKAQEALLSVGPRLWLSEHQAIQVNVGSRIGDAWVIGAQYYRDNWTVGITYDVNYSPFQIATNRQGALEIAALYRPKVPLSAKEIKVCPIF
jgi:type IX secretion system PorP/SprF family membrane protein